jgi:hypothetical protein
LLMRLVETEGDAAVEGGGFVAQRSGEVISLHFEVCEYHGIEE